MKDITHINLKPQPGSSQRESNLLIGAGSLAGFAELYEVGAYSKLFVVTDETVAPLWLDKLLGLLPSGTKHIILPPGEQAKNIDNTQKIWAAMKDAGCDRKSLVINLGGGVICDMGGFAASTYMRGVDFVHVPTTLLSQVDASIGGKTGIDFGGIKNLIGTFSQPKAVIIDPEVLKTLPEREFVAGFGEIIKHGAITSEEYLQKVIAKQPLDFSPEELADIIAESCRIKAKVVQEDAKESGLRQILNFGHTIGHAVEALSLESDSPLLHGEAVAIGMVVEADISSRLGLLAGETSRHLHTLIQEAGLPTSIPSFADDQLLERMTTDKKNKAGSIRFVLLKGIGKPVYNQTADEATIRTVLEENRE